MTPFSLAGWQSLRRVHSDKISALLLIAPALSMLGLFAIVPILAVLWLSGWRYLPIFQHQEFVWWENYARVLLDERFWHAFGVTVYFTSLSVTAEVGIGLAIALALNRFVQGSSGTLPVRSRIQLACFQAVLLVPWAVPTVVSARMWEWLYHWDAGLLNYVLLSAGLASQPVEWLSDPAWAIHAAILMDVWKTTPFAAVLLLAGRAAIPRDIVQAAQVDGASTGTLFRRIILPLLAPVLLIVLVFRTMDAVRVFDAVYVLTAGGPGNSTETLSVYTYRMLFQTLQFGYGSALAVVMFLVVLVIAGVYGVLLRRQLGKLES